MGGKALVVGVGMVPFTKPGKSDSYDVMGAAAGRAALSDAGIAYSLVEQAYAGYVYGDSTCGQAAVYGMGLTGIPVVNVNNNCATGSTALFLARQAVESGSVECALAMGFEQMTPGALIERWTDRPTPLSRFIDTLRRLGGWDDSIPMAPQLFCAAAREYREKYGIRPEVFAKISCKARKHAANNPFAIFRKPVTVEEVLGSPMVADPLTRLQCCPPTCGAAAAILCSPAFARRHHLDTRVAVAAQAMTTDREDSFTDSPMRVIGYGMTRDAARKVYEIAGVGPEDVDVAELHDCFTVNELITYEALELTPEGTAERFISEGGNTYGGKVVTNPSGGLLSKGHPLGATGLAQCAELVWQLRGQAGPRQVEGARHALQHNLGLGGACVVTLYSAA
ncbi:MAG: lipid-transfer protein [Deltaproteobacteria bacterium]|nr:MAG: lipid-transfer protein [Deltaproteobacteria bacterium]